MHPRAAIAWRIGGMSFLFHHLTITKKPLRNRAAFEIDLENLSSLRCSYNSLGDRSLELAQVDRQIILAGFQQERIQTTTMLN